VIDLMSITPSYLSLFFPAAHVVMGVRILRMLFRLSLGGIRIRV